MGNYRRRRKFIKKGKNKNKIIGEEKYSKKKKKTKITVFKIEGLLEQ